MARTEEVLRDRVSFGSRIQQRWVFAVMGSLALINKFMMRMSLSVAITEMVKPMETTSNHTSDDTCQHLFSAQTYSNSSGTGTYEWDEYTQGAILSSFYWGSVFTQIPGGLLAVRFGGKYLLGFGILSTGILTLLTPIVVETYGPTGLMVLRCLTGIGESATFPALISLIGHWAPPDEVTRISTTVLSGMPIGTVLGKALSGVLIRYSPIGWPIVFYFFGSCGVLWSLAWVVLGYSRPDLHPFISEEEKNYLQEATSQHTQEKKKPTPWRHIVASPPLWALLIGTFGFSWGFNVMVSDLPKYMSNVLKFSIQENGLLSAAPHIMIWVISNASSWLADWMMKKDVISRTAARKVLTVTASVMSGIFLVAASYTGCDRILVVIFFTLSVGTMGFYFPGLMVNLNDLSPNYSGMLVGVTNLIGIATGVAAPYVVGVLTPHQTLSEWRIVFWISFMISCGTSSVFAIWGDAEVQHWNNPEPEREKQVEPEDGKASIAVYSVFAKESDRGPTKHCEKTL